MNLYIRKLPNLTRRSEYELLVRLTDERKPLVYPNGAP